MCVFVVVVVVVVVVLLFIKTAFLRRNSSLNVNFVENGFFFTWWEKSGGVGEHLLLINT